MPYASSIKLINDANGTAYAFLVSDGLLWQCQWNAQAQSWDRGQVVPGVYGGEKLQALLVEDLWPTSGVTGEQKGNTPGIVLAYRVGEGDAARVFATLGRWGSEGQLSWSEPLKLNDSGIGIEEIALAPNGEAGFQLVCQAREPVDESLAALDGASNASVPHKDSELTIRSFVLSGSDTTGFSLVDRTAGSGLGSTGQVQPVTTAVNPAAVAAPATAVGGNTQFSRADFQLAPMASVALQSRTVATAEPQMMRAQASGESGGNWTWNGGFGGEYSGANGFNFTAGLLVGQTRVRWQLQVPNSSPPVDWDIQNTTNDYGERIIWPRQGKNFLQNIPSTKYENRLGLIGSFGFGGYGSESVTNDFGITFIREKRTEWGNIDTFLRRLSEKLQSIDGLKFNSIFFTIAGNTKTEYMFDSFDSFTALGDLSLEKVKTVYTASLGLAFEQRRRFTTGGYLQWSIGGTFGVAFKQELKPTGGAETMPLWLAYFSYTAPTVGAGIQAFESPANWNLSVVENLNTPSTNRGPTNTWINKTLLRNDKNTSKDPYEFYQGVEIFDALVGASLFLAPQLSDISDQVGRSRWNYGLIATANAGVRYLYKGIAGAYLNVKDSLQWYPSQQAAFNTGSFQNKFMVNAGLALPFGASIPLLAFQLTSPKPPQATARMAMPTAAATPVVASAGLETASPLLYTPASGSTLLPSTESSPVVPLLEAATPLKLYTLTGYDTGVVTPDTATLSTPVVLANAGSGLLDGSYTDVPVMGTLLPGSAPASLNFTVLNGAIQAASVTINVPSPDFGRYLHLPQTTEISGIYALLPDVFSTGILANPSAAGGASLSTLLQQLPLITIHTSRTGSPLQTENIVAVQQVIPLTAAVNQPTALYPNPTPSDNRLISYSSVNVVVSDANVNVLNNVTATVSLSNGTIVQVVLDEPLFLTATNGVTPAELDMTLDLQSVLGPDVVNPTYTVMPQATGVNNLVENYSYIANPGFSANSGLQASVPSTAQAVWLEDGISSQLQLTPSQGHWPVCNRVVAQSGDTIVYLNASTIGDNGVVTQATADPSDVSLQGLYNSLADPGRYGAVPSFSAASTPTVITFAPQASSGGTPARLAGDSAVFWVEASEPVIPLVSNDGTINYQAFLTALYGQQRVNYRIFNTKNGTWSAPNTVDLYMPDNAVIRNLRAFNVELGGSTRTLLVWDETSIDTIKEIPSAPIAIQGWISDTSLSLSGGATALRIGDLIGGDGVEKGTLITGIISPLDPLKGSATYRISRSQFVGSSSQPVALTATPLLPPSVLKAGFINLDAPSMQWSSLFSDARGQSTITTIPWDQSNEIGVDIDSLSVASQQVVDASGSVLDTAVLSWSENVRTPYVQSVLNDEPLIYLQFANLKPGFNDINIGSTAASTTTGTVASISGLNLTIASALSKSAASAVQNFDGTGVLSTGTGSQNALYTQILNSTPKDQLPTSPFAQLTGSISGTSLIVSSLSGELAVGDLLTGPGLLPDTQITAVLTAFDPTSGKGTYSINQSQSLTSTSLEALPNPAPLSGQDLGLPYSSFTGSITGTTLSVNQLNGSLEVGDGIVGKGVSAGTTIAAVLSFDPATGSGSYGLNQSQTLPTSALIATPSSSVPYTIEFWTQLPAGSNADHGAGLVAFGQPSEQAVGAAVAPSGWLMTASFSVERITYQQAAALGSQKAYNKLNAQSAKPGDLFAWSWSLDATGANTSALGGNGGSNLYSNALTLSNLSSGQILTGVDAFLNNYQLKPADLVGGDGLFANTIDLVPVCSLDFNHSLDPETGLPVSNLNAISIDTSSTQLNSGLVPTINANEDLSGDPEKNKSLQAMFKALWNYQQTYGQAKVGFTLDPVAPSQPGDGFEQYGGYGLEFFLAPGPAVSVDNTGQLVFDVANGVSITSAPTDPIDNRDAPLPSDLRDGAWHHVAATYLPDYRSYTINGVLTQVPMNRGTASLYVDNQLVASAINVTGAYVASNINDNALLLANNAGGAIDQFALFDKALLPAPPLSPNPDGAWPQASPQQALAILKQLGYPASEQTPNPGAIESALSEHWRSRNVNPNAALLSTFSSVFDPNTNSWSQAGPLNPQPQLESTLPSAIAPSLQQDLVITIAPGDWSQPLWTVTGQTDPVAFNPAGDQLRSISVTLTPDQGGDLVTRQLSPQQVLIGASTSLASLQPKASSSDLHTTILSNKPALNLLISRLAKNQGDVNNLDLNKTYRATFTLNFTDPSQVTPTPMLLTRSVNGFNTGQSVDTLDTSRSRALATASVIEAAPLQLKYINSGVVLKSASSLAAANSPAALSPATSFGQSQAYGWFKTTGEASGVNQYSGWLAVAQPNSANAISNPAGRVWIQYTGDFTSSDAATSTHTAVSDTSKAPNTWLIALANSNFSPEAPNQPLLADARHPSAYGGLLIQADPTAGWGQNFGQTMLVADLNGDGVDDLVISAPSANGGGKVAIIDGSWIQANLTRSNGSTILNLANPDNLGPHVTVLSPGRANGPSYAADDASQASFGWALAFEKTSRTLYIGAPNYSRTVGSDAESVPTGAIYQYQNSSSDTASTQVFNAGSVTLDSNYAVGMAGKTSTNDVSGPYTSYWGAQLGASLAVSDEGSLAAGAPGVQASLLYSGTEYAEQQAALKKDPSSPYDQGALIRIMLPTPASMDDQNVGLDATVNSTAGTSNPDLVDVISNNTTDKESALAEEESLYMQALKALQTKPIAKANIVNNPAIQTAAVGSVYFFRRASSLPTGSVTPSKASSTLYGPNPWNTQGDTDFGSSLSFGDLSNTNAQSILAIGAPRTGGPGAVYMVNTSQRFDNPSTAPKWIRDTNLGSSTLGENQYLAHLASALTLYGAEDLDNFGNGLVNLGDTNRDGYTDLLIQASNALAGAGSGYVIFGNDQLIENLTSNTLLADSTHNPAVGSVSTGNSGQIRFADGRSLRIPILSERGFGVSAGTALGSYGSGDVDANGNNDILLGSTGNGQAYLTWGHDYLAAINNLQLQKLASDTGYLLEGLATTNKSSLRSIGDFNDDGYGDFFTIIPGDLVNTVRIELGASTQEILANYRYNYYTFTIAHGTEVQPCGDINGDGFSDIALFIDQNLSRVEDGNAGAGSTTGILYGRSSKQLPLGSGFGFLAPVDASSSPLAALPGQGLAGGLTDADPSVISVGNTLYAAVKGVGIGNTSIWFTQSSDGGNSWNNWTDLSTFNSGFASDSGPSLEFFRDRLYLSFTNLSGDICVASWDPSSNNQLAWGEPQALSSSGQSESSFRSDFSPKLVDRGDSLGVVWVDAESGTVKTTSSSTPTPGPLPTPWAVVNGGSSLGTPALARDGDTVYMAVQCGPNNSSKFIYWTSSIDGGRTWGTWQALPSTMTTYKPPSLAVVNGILYLSYLGIGNKLVNITSLDNAATNNWSPVYQIPSVAADYASLTTESVEGIPQLSVYYVSNDGTNRILKAYTPFPRSSRAWLSNLPIQYGNNIATQTSSGPLTLSQYNGQTYIAYQGGTRIILATSSSGDVNNGASWSAQSLLDPGITTNVGLSNSPDGLYLSYSNSTPGLQLTRLAVESGNLNVAVGNADVVALPADLSTNVAILSGESADASNLLLAGINTQANSNYVQTSVLYPSYDDSSWAPAKELLERTTDSNGDIQFSPIAATAAPSVSMLAGASVLAVNDNGTIKVYGGEKGNVTMQQTSFFTPEMTAGEIISAPALITTDTGLALTYTNADGSIRVERLNFLQPDGTPLQGVVLNPDGSIDTSAADLQWKGITLSQSKDGVSSDLSTSPLFVNGQMLLGSVRNSARQKSQIWINSIPNLSKVEDTTWMNTSVQLGTQWATGDWTNGIGGATPSPASLTTDGNMLYIAVRGMDDHIYWNSSSDNGSSPNKQYWQALSFDISTKTAPSIAIFGNTLYLCYVDAASNDLMVTYLQADGSWLTPYRIAGQSASAASMIAEDDHLAIYSIANDPTCQILKSYTSQPNTDSWTTTSVLYGGGANQTASSNLALTRYQNQTYLAYQGGTDSTPSNSIYLTTASDSTANSGSPIWTFSETPSSMNPLLQRGVGLTSNANGLILTYTGSSDVGRVAIQHSNSEVTTWMQLDDAPALNSNIAYTPLITADAHNPLVIAGMDSNYLLNMQQNAVDVQILSQRVGLDNSIGGGLSAGAWQNVAQGYALSQAALTRDGNTVYMAVRGTDNHLYWNNSIDNGLTWNSWRGLPDDMGTFTSPSLAYFNNRLYLCYVAAGSNDLNITSMDAAGNWTDQYRIQGQSATAASMIGEGNQLAVYFIANDPSDRLLKTYTTSPDSSTNWTTTSILYSGGANQTASSNLALTRYNNQTYIAYQGGTYGTPNSSIYLTTTSDDIANGASPIWSLLDTPTGIQPVQQRGVGLTSGSQGLVLTYTDSSHPNQVSAQLSDRDLTGWLPLTDRISLSSSIGYTPLLTASSQNPLLVAGMDSNTAINVQLNELNKQVLMSAQTRSQLSAVGDINHDGFDDLAISANNVAYSPSGDFQSSDAQLTTGVRFVLGAATATSLIQSNNANASQQAVQIANLYPQPSYTQTAASATPLAHLTGPFNISLTGLQDGNAVQISSAAWSPTSGSASLTANASDPNSLYQLFGAATASTPSISTGPWTSGSASSSLQTRSGYGDLNADGYVDYLNAVPATIFGADGMSWSLWSICAAGDVNGNGVDDVLLTLRPQGPAYGDQSLELPADLQSVLVDGSLFKVDTTTDSFRLDQLRIPLNPYNRNQLYNDISTSSSDYLPSLQNWLEPILPFIPGQLSSVSISNKINPAGARSYSSPSVAISPAGAVYLVFPGADTAGPNGASGLWMTYQQDDDWLQIRLPVGDNASIFPPSATFFQGKLYISYREVQTGNLYIAYCDGPPEDSSSVNWHSYQVATVAAESTRLFPTLISEAGRLALYFPDNSGSPGKLRYLYSTDPDNSRFGSNGYGNWGGRFDAAIGGYSGVSGETDIQVSYQVSAASFHGRTVLAYLNQDDHLCLRTQVSSIPTAADPSPSLSWMVTDTGVTPNSAVFSITTDQSLLYLATTESLRGFRINPDGTWSQDSVQSLSLPYPQAFVLGGQLMIATGSRDNPSIQVANVDVTVGSPAQRSLVGYSIDGDIDTNGDGFMDMLISDPSDPSQSVDNQYTLFGGDYLNIASHAGTPADDVLLGTPLADVIYALQGADHVTSDGGADVIYTGAGDDIISIDDNAFIRVDAGSGFDMLRLEGQANQSYDFSLDAVHPQYFVGTKLRNIELLNSVDYGANLLRFDAASINAFNSDRVLFVTPDAGDIISLSSDFSRNPVFDTSSGGTLWSAYTADLSGSSPANATPGLLYVATPIGQSADWLSTNVGITDPLLLASRSLMATAPPETSDSSDPVVTLPASSPISSSQSFGQGLTLVAYNTLQTSEAARFSIQRSDTSRRQVVLYASSTANSSAQPGRDFIPVAGVVVLLPGQSSQTITVPIDSAAFALLRGGSLSLQVEELPDQGQLPLDLLIAPDVSKKAGSLTSELPVLSGFDLIPSPGHDSATLRFRADSNDGSLDSLLVTLSQRNSPSSSTVTSSRSVSLLDAIVTRGQLPPAFDALPGSLALDHDNSHNEQVSAQLALNFSPLHRQPTVNLLAPSLNWQSPLQLSSNSTFLFSKTVPFTIWRADSGSSAVTFGLEGGGKTITLLSDAIGGDVGSITPQVALDNDPGHGWRSSEGKAVGSRAVVDAMLPAGTAWKPTASSNGSPLELLSITQEGNQVTATFQDGATAVYGLQTTGKAQTPTAILPEVTVQRLAGFDNALAFYAIDGITGAVDGRNPGDKGYLQLALARSEASGLLLTSDQLPAYGDSNHYTDLPFNINKDYGVLLLVNGDRSRIYSSFSAANPNAAAQVISLGNDSTGLVLGFEDLAAVGAGCDADYNDVMVRIGNVSVPLF